MWHKPGALCSGHHWKRICPPHSSRHLARGGVVQSLGLSILDCRFGGRLCRRTLHAGYRLATANGVDPTVVQSEIRKETLESRICVFLLLRLFRRAYIPFTLSI